jgi:hypothetical protein
MRVSARIPVVCTISAPQLVAQQSSEIVTGTLFESCNTNRGFLIMASHRPLEQGEAASIYYDGQRSDLEAGGLSLVQSRFGARHGPVQVSVGTESLSAPIAISFAVTPV